MTLVLPKDALVGSAPALNATRTSPDLLRFITCGSVDDGKSTLIGRLLYDSKSVFDDQLETLDQDSRRFGTQGTGLDFALLVDGLSAEREQGITIDVAYRYFATERRSFIVADTPGHEQYTRNMATGASTAELAVILIDARKGILPQTRRHSFIVSMLGVRHVAVAINKMDMVGYDRSLFERIASVYRTMAADLGFMTIEFFPISALTGDNVARHSTATPWFRGKTLLDFLETVEIDAAPSQDGFLLPVQWVNRPDPHFRGYAGMVCRGPVRRGDEVLILPRGLRSRVERIVTFDGDLESASNGQSVTLVLADDLDVSRGDVIANPHFAPPVADRLRARLLWTGEQPLNGSSFLLQIGSTLAQARIEVEHVIDIQTFEASPEKALTTNTIAMVELSLDRPLACPSYEASRELGGFILVDKVTNETSAFGFIEPAPEQHAADESQRDARSSRYVRGLMVFLTGHENAEASSADLAEFGAMAIGGAILVLLLTRSWVIALAFLVADGLLRPAIRLLVRTIAAARVKTSESELNSDGAGI